MRKKKKLIILLLVLFISIGFAILSANLSINGGVGFNSNNFDVHFENIKVISEDVDYSTLEVDSSDNTKINASINFKEPSEIFEYSVDVVNGGGIDAIFDSLTNNINSSLEDYISVDIKYFDNSSINQNDLLRMGQSKRLRVKIIYNYDIDSLPQASTSLVTTSISYKNINVRDINYDRNVWNYEFTGYEQMFVTPKAGTYKVELWGSEGVAYSGFKSGKGAYVTGNIELDKEEKFYIYVGNQSAFATGACHTTNLNNTFNGSYYGGCGIGGGATDIRLTKCTEWYKSDSLASRIIVAGAGGSTLGYVDTESGQNGYGGSAGGLRGQAGLGNDPRIVSQVGRGATQTQFNFGLVNNTSTTTGGGGYYTGENGYGASSGGGSSFISGYKGCIAITAEDNLTPKCTEEEDPTNQDISCSYHYSGYKFTDGVMIAGNEQMTDPDGSTVTGHSGNGYARITLID